MLERICVFCGSSPGARPDYVEAARSLGAELVARELVLVYGGGNVGLMGALADAVLSGGGRVIGVIPQSLVSLEVAHGGLTELRVVASMHERKAEMTALADAFVSLPGGFGTLDELFETLTWAQLGIHAKPCALLDVAGYYRRLIDLLDHAVTEGFLREAHRGMLFIDDEPGRLLDELGRRPVPDLGNGIGRDPS